MKTPEINYCVNGGRVINEIIDGEAIMIDLVTGTYYNLDRVGGDIWVLLEAGLPTAQIVAELSSRYTGDRTEIEQGVMELLEQLAGEQLIVPCTEPALAARPDLVAMPHPPEAFRRPLLEKYTDMQDLILLDPVHQVDTRGWPHRPEGEL